MATVKPFRTDAQRLANSVDMHLFRLLGEAEQMATETRSQNWRNIVDSLRSARGYARYEMHPDDSLGTL